MTVRAAMLLIIILIPLFFCSFPFTAAENTGKEEPKSPSPEATASVVKVSEEALGHYKKGRELFNQGKLDEALEEYRKTLEAAPDFDYAWASLGYIYFQREKYEEAKKHYEKAIELKPGDDFYQGQLAQVYVRLGNRDKAVECLNRAIELAPDNWAHYYNLGELTYENREVDAACTLVEKALKLCKDRQWRVKIRQKLREIKPKRAEQEKKKEAESPEQ